MDLHGAVWLGSEQGELKVYEMSTQRKQAAAASLVLSERQSLRLAPAGGTDAMSEAACACMVL